VKGVLFREFTPETIHGGNKMRGIAAKDNGYPVLFPYIGVDTCILFRLGGLRQKCRDVLFVMNPEYADYTQAEKED
jgi:hypothetical protein